MSGNSKSAVPATPFLVYCYWSTTYVNALTLQHQCQTCYWIPASVCYSSFLNIKSISAYQKNNLSKNTLHFAVWHFSGNSQESGNLIAYEKHCTLLSIGNFSTFIEKTIPQGNTPAYRSAPIDWLSRKALCSCLYQNWVQDGRAQIAIRSMLCAEGQRLQLGS